MPNPLVEGQDASILVEGDGFAGTSVVTVNGVAVQTTLICERLLRAEVPGQSGTGSAVGEIQLGVTTPGTGEAIVPLPVSPSPIDPETALGAFELAVDELIKFAEDQYLNIETAAIAQIDGVFFLSEIDPIVQLHVQCLDALKAAVEAAIERSFTELVEFNARWLQDFQVPSVGRNARREAKERGRQSHASGVDLKNAALQQNASMASQAVESVLLHGAEAQEQEAARIRHCVIVLMNVPDGGQQFPDGSPAAALVIYLSADGAGPMTWDQGGHVVTLGRIKWDDGAGHIVIAYDGFGDAETGTPCVDWPHAGHTHTGCNYYKVIRVWGCTPVVFRQFQRRHFKFAYCPEPLVPDTGQPPAPHEFDDPSNGEYYPDPQGDCPPGSTYSEEEIPTVTCTEYAHTTLTEDNDDGSGGIDGGASGTMKDAPGDDDGGDNPPGRPPSSPNGNLVASMEVDHHFRTAIWCGSNVLAVLSWGFNLTFTWPCDDPDGAPSSSISPLPELPHLDWLPGGE